MHSERLQLIGQIELTEAEQELARKIAFDLDNIRLEHEQAIENGELAATLMQCLIDRKAIPENRLRYFGDPDYNPNNAKASKANLFLRNAKTLEQMYRHPNFVRYLKYFVYGADLPPAIKEAFFAKAQEHFVTSEELVQLARSLVRNFYLIRYPRAHNLPDTFYQLALDCGCDQWDARRVREAIMKLK
jgi:hypothetical protein